MRINILLLCYFLQLPLFSQNAKILSFPNDFFPQSKFCVLEDGYYNGLLYFDTGNIGAFNSGSIDCKIGFFADSDNITEIYFCLIDLDGLFRKEFTFNSVNKDNTSIDVSFDFFGERKTYVFYGLKRKIKKA